MRLEFTTFKVSKDDEQRAYHLLHRVTHPILTFNGIVIDKRKKYQSIELLNRHEIQHTHD